MTNEKKNIFDIFIAVVGIFIFIVFSAATVTAAILLGNTRRELESCRGELEYYREGFRAAENRKSELESTVREVTEGLDRVSESVSTTSELLNNVGATVQSLRAVLRDIRENEKAMEDELNHLRSIVRGIDDDSNNSSDKEIEYAIQE